MNDGTKKPISTVPVLKINIALKTIILYEMMDNDRPVTASIFSFSEITEKPADFLMLVRNKNFNIQFQLEENYTIDDKFNGLI